RIFFTTQKGRSFANVIFDIRQDHQIRLKCDPFLLEICDLLNRVIPADAAVDDAHGASKATLQQRLEPDGKNLVLWHAPSKHDRISKSEYSKFLFPLWQNGTIAQSMLIIGDGHTAVLLL